MLLRDLPIKIGGSSTGHLACSSIRAKDEEIDDVAIVGASSTYAADKTDDHLLLCILGDVQVVLDRVTLDTVHRPGRTWTFGVHPPT